MELNEESKIALGICSCPNEDSANSLAEVLLESKLVACVSILPKMTSHYTWQGKVEKEKEVLLLIKTEQNSKEKVAKLLGEKHPYDNPELIFLAADSASRAYEAWLFDSIE